ncbi:hypothetical protein CHISP_1791 [Chitinispirillum alkaliphilum]|nr:hypothetical protein CHISP_1791 [Chitinispirillum alkaliphilum]
MSVSFSSPAISPINRYELSREYIEAIHSSIEHDPPFLSLPNTFLGDRYLPLNFIYQDQTLSFDVNFITAFENQLKSMGFGVIDASGQFETPWLFARVRFNGYGAQGYPQTRFAEPKEDFQEIAYERFFSGRRSPIRSGPEVDFTLPEAHMTFIYRNLELGFGREKLRWGPGYKGTLLHSGYAHAPFYFYHFKLNMADRIHMSAYLSGYDDENAFRYSDFTKEKVPPMLQDKPLPARYGAAHRLDIKFNKHFQLGIYEKVNFFGTQDLIRYANPFQIYYIGLHTGNNYPNKMGGIDFNLVFHPLRIYGELLNDDITSFDTVGNPSKYGLQLGASWYFDNDILREIGIEYTHITYYMYGHYTILNRHTYWNQSMGWPWGNDQDLFHARALFRLRPDLHAKIEANYWLIGEGKIRDEWYDDGRPNFDDKPYFPENPDHILSFILSGSYSPRDWLTLNMYYRPWWINGDFNQGFHAFMRVGIPGRVAYRLE